LRDRMALAGHPSDDALPPGEPPLLELRSISRTYGRVEALRDVDLALLRGEVHALFGDNGAGKSTLLQIAAGAIRPDAGSILFHGVEIPLDSPLEAREHGIETVYQDLALADERSCTANVFIGREVRRGGMLGRMGFLDRRVMDRRTREEFGRLSVPIGDVKRPARLLSGGQRQGVAIARAAMWARDTILLDEPTASLGVRQRDHVADLISGLRSKGFAILLVSHDVPWALRLADRVSVLRLGQRVASRRADQASVTWAVAAMVGEVPV
jgi:simple sugar transport system ATP-binding protein